MIFAHQQPMPLLPICRPLPHVPFQMNSSTTKKFSEELFFLLFSLSIVSLLKHGISLKKVLTFHNHHSFFMKQKQGKRLSFPSVVVSSPHVGHLLFLPPWQKSSTIPRKAFKKNSGTNVRGKIHNLTITIQSNKRKRIVCITKVGKFVHKSPLSTKHTPPPFHGFIESSYGLLKSHDLFTRKNNQEILLLEENFTAEKS